MTDEPKTCDLCQLPIHGEGFVLLTRTGPKRFCCEGCEGIYRMLHEADILEPPSKEL